MAFSASRGLLYTEPPAEESNRQDADQPRDAGQNRDADQTPADASDASVSSPTPADD